MPGTDSIQIGSPALSRMRGPPLFAPLSGVRKTNPGATAPAGVSIVTTGASRSGRVWKLRAAGDGRGDAAGDLFPATMPGLGLRELTGQAPPDAS